VNRERSRSAGGPTVASKNPTFSLQLAAVDFHNLHHHYAQRLFVDKELNPYMVMAVDDSTDVQGQILSKLG
jgi:hypothetical protein